jgi:hypothetical protein
MKIAKSVNRLGVAAVYNIFASSRENISKPIEKIDKIHK